MVADIAEPASTYPSGAKSSLLLTEAKIQALRPPKTGQVEYCDTLVPGLRVRIGVSGAKSFVLRKRVAGKYRNITLGRYSERLPLAEARKKSRQILSDIEFKADPVASLPKPQKRRTKDARSRGVFALLGFEVRRAAVWTSIGNATDGAQEQRGGHLIHSAFAKAVGASPHEARAIEQANERALAALNIEPAA